jgi:hypothetical protein
VGNAADNLDGSEPAEEALPVLVEAQGGRLYRARLRIRSALERALPKRDAPPVAYSTQVCLDLLQAKQDTLDRGGSFEFPNPVVCERCAEFFATMDLAQGICHEIAKGELPPELRAALLDRVSKP